MGNGNGNVPRVTRKCTLCSKKIDGTLLREHLGDAHSDHAYGWDMDLVIEQYEEPEYHDEEQVK